MSMALRVACVREAGRRWRVTDPSPRTPAVAARAPTAGSRAGLVTFAQWLVLGSLIGLLCGAASALFLFLLQSATNFRVSHELIVYSLPLAGALIGLIYQRFGRSIAAGSNLIIDT